MLASWAISSRRHTSRYEADGNTSPLSSDEGEGPRTRAVYRQKTPEKFVNRKVGRARNPTRAEVYRGNTISRSTARFERRSTDRNRRTSPSVESGDVYITTMDEDDQQMFIALFYWRRKVIEAHFSAWKWMVFTLRRSERQIQRRERNVRPSSAFSSGYDLRPTRRNLILKRHTGPPSVEESEKTNSDVGLEKHLQRRSPSIPDTNRDIDNCPDPDFEKRRQFRDQLRLVYSCFGQWKTNAGKARSGRVQQLVRAAGIHRVQLLKASLRVWRNNSRTLKLERRRLHDADRFRSDRTKRSVFHELKRYYRIEREITRRKRIYAAQRKKLAFQYWWGSILQKRACRTLAEKTSYRHLRRVLGAFRDGTIQARQRRWKSVAATSHYHKKRQLEVLYLWKKAISEDPSYLLSVDRNVQISLSTGVRRWRRFMIEQQTQGQKMLLADFFRYRTLLRRAVRAWGQFLDWKQRRKQFCDQVLRHYERTLKTRSIYQLRAAASANRTQRVKVRKATRWHQRNLNAQSFNKWVNYAQNSSRIKTFRRARTITTVFRTWRSHARTRLKLRVAHNTVTERCDGLILKIYMVRWLRTLHVVSFAKSIELKHRNLNIAIHFRAWQNWSKAKISKRNIVIQHRCRNEGALLERIVSQWLGVVLREKCLKRLVKLFQKKQGRNRVKFIFRLWHLHVHIRVATRKRDLDRARLLLLEWKRVSKDWREKRMIMTVAKQYYSERRYALSIKVWFAFARRSSSSRRADSKSLSYYFRRILVKSLRNWYIAVRKLRRRKEFLAGRQQLREEKTMTQYLRSWYSLTLQQAQRRIRILSALQFQRESLQRRSFHAWMEFLDSRRASCERTLFAIATHENMLQGKVLRVWCHVTRRSVQLKRGFVLARRMTKQRLLQWIVDNWSKFCFERQHRRQQSVIADNFYNEYLKCLAMFQWQEKWSQRVLMRQKELTVTKQMNTRRLAKGFSNWYGNFLHKSRILSKKTEARHFYTMSVQTKHFKLWKSYNEAARYQASKRRRIAIQQKHKLLGRLFRNWYRFSKASGAQRRLIYKAEAHQATSVLNRVFQRWKRYRNKLTLHVIAYTYRRRLLLRNIWLGWKQHRHYAAMVRHNVLVTSHLVRNNLSRATLMRWKAYVVRRREGQAAFNRAEDHYTQWMCKRGVAGLRKYFKFHQAVVKAATLGKITGIRHFWSRWRRYVAVQQSKHSRIMAAERAHDRREMQRHFCVWKSLTRRCIQVLRDKSEALYRASCLRLMWARWNRAVKWRRCLIAMENRRIGSLQVVILRRWRGYVGRLVDQRVKTAKAVTFRRANLGSKAWQSWLRYVTYCYDKQKQLERVLIYYSVEVLLRRSLTSWKELVERRQAQRERQEVADSFATHRLLCEQYRQWADYINERKVKQECIKTLLHTAEALALSRTVKKWRKRAIELRQHHRSEVTANQFYDERRLSYGLNKLIQWRTSQKIDRRLMAQAKHFQDNTVQLMCFRRWQRYHHWRVKYAHLTLVFRCNQKANAFTHWKRYWKKRQFSNDKRLEARVFHCVHAEQKMLRLWRMFILLRKQKKVAIAFNTAKVFRGTFIYWRHRAHVLGTVREMLASQESFRAQTHFDAWKKFIAARKLKAERLRKAMKFKNNLRKLDVWHKWRDCVLARKQERVIIEMAVGFRLRFSTRKTFAVWKTRAGNWKRRRNLTSQAQLQYQTSLLYQSFQLLVRCMQSRRRLIQLQSALSIQLVEIRKRRAISRLRALCAESERKRNLIERACCHWQLRHREKFWGRILQWFKAAEFRRQQRIRADFFARTHLLQRYVSALKQHIRHSKQLKVKVDAFRCRFFRSVADDCFYQWRSFTTFKLKLQAVRWKSLQSRRRQRLHQWHRIARDQARRREGMQQLALRRRYRELVVLFNHWESVCTDLWIDQQLVAHHQHHAQKQRRLRFAINMLKSQLPARHERLKRKSFFLQHHRQFLVQVLQCWKLATVDQRNHFNM